MTLYDLVSRGLATISKNARGNPQGLAFKYMAVGFANKDYPAQTPWLWNSVYQALDLPQRNIRLFADPVDIDQIVATMKTDPLYIGGDIGVGFKDKMWQLVDEVDPLARIMQAINVVVKKNGRLIGYNTDGLGYAQSLVSLLIEKGLALPDPRPLLDKRILLLGAGGTTSAIAAALASMGAQLVILNRTESKAQELAERLNQHFKKQIALWGPRTAIPQEIKQVDVIVSAIDEPDSPMYKYSALGQIDLPATDENIRKNLVEAEELMRQLSDHVVISDVVLRNEDTATIREAKEMGLLTLDGRPMVLNQAIEAFWVVNQQKLERLGVSKEDIALSMIEASRR